MLTTNSLPMAGKAFLTPCGSTTWNIVCAGVMPMPVAYTHLLKDAGGEPGGGGLSGDRREILLVVHLLARIAAEIVEGGGFRIIAAFDHPLGVLDVEVEPPEACLLYTS